MRIDRECTHHLKEIRILKDPLQDNTVMDLIDHLCLIKIVIHQVE